MYIRAELDKCGRLGSPIWWSSAEIVFERCPDKRFLFDLVTYSYCKDPVSLILTARRIDKKIRFVDTPNVNAPYIVSRDMGPNIIEEVLLTVSSNPDYFIDKEIEDMYKSFSSTPQEQTQRTGFLRIFRRPGISLARRREVQKEILRGLLREMLRSLCIEKFSEKPRIVSYKPVYYLAIIDLENKRYYECLGKRIIESRIHERYVFENPKLVETLSEIFRLWHG